MKFIYGNFLAICVASSAFVLPAPSFSRAGRLASSMPGPGNDGMGMNNESPFFNSMPPGQYAPTPVGPGGAVMPPSGGKGSAKNVMQKAAEVRVEGGSLKTFALQSAAIERVQVILGTDGRPMDADLDLWNGPNNTPYRLRIYVQDGNMRPFNAIIETPRGPNTVAVRNTGQIEFPISSYVSPNCEDNAKTASSTLSDSPKTVQGGALKTYPFESNVDSVQVLLTTDGRPLNARIELLQGPNNVKQIVELFVEDGMDRPFYCIIETPGSGNVVRVVNSASVEFPLNAQVSPYVMGEYESEFDMIVSSDRGSSFGSFGSDRQWG